MWCSQFTNRSVWFCSYANLVEKKIDLVDRREVTKSRARLNQWMKKKRRAEANVFCSHSSIQMEALMEDFFIPRLCFHPTVSAQTLCHTLFSLSQMDHDPRNPTYISSQGPLPSTVADFWQVILIFILCSLSSRTVFFPPWRRFGRNTTELTQWFSVIYLFLCDSELFFLV